MTSNFGGPLTVMFAVKPVGTKPKLPSAFNSLFKANIIAFRDGMKERQVPLGHCLRKTAWVKSPKKCDVR